MDIWVHTSLHLPKYIYIRRQVIDTDYFLRKMKLLTFRCLYPVVSRCQVYICFLFTVLGGDTLSHWAALIHLRPPAEAVRSRCTLSFKVVWNVKVNCAKRTASLNIYLSSNCWFVVQQSPPPLKSPVNNLICATLKWFGLLIYLGKVTIQTSNYNIIPFKSF